MTGAEQLMVLESISEIGDFRNKLIGLDQYPVRARDIEVMQINVGKRCNLSCRHCHVNAGPQCTEIMTKEVFEKCFEILKESPEISTIDITGGAPEINPYLKNFIEKISKLNRRCIVRSNLVILLDDAYSSFIDLYARLKIEVVVSLPDYIADKSDRQRGSGNFIKCITVIKKLNSLGYGKTGTGLVLNIVHNPAGAYLPGSQSVLEHEYKSRLKKEHNIEFNSLFCITNLPVGRYLDFLQTSDNLRDYMVELERHFNGANMANIMCRSMISVGWDGALYDCDFNQMLGLTVAVSDSKHIFQFCKEQIVSREIVVRSHCYGCTAGSGSSCQGAIGLIDEK